MRLEQAEVLFVRQVRRRGGRSGFQQIFDPDADVASDLPQQDRRNVATAVKRNRRTTAVNAVDHHYTGVQGDLLNAIERWLRKTLDS